MLSLKRSLTEYDRAQTLASALKSTLVATLDAARQYVIPTDPASVKGFRAHLTSIVGEVESVHNPDGECLYSVTSRIREAWRAYHDHAAVYVDQLRASLASTTDVLREMLTSFQSGDSDAEKQLKTEILRLRSADELKDLDEMRACVRRSVGSLASCVDSLRREKDVVIAQLRDEIRTLQKSMEEEHRAAAMDAATGAHQRPEFEKMVQREIVRNQPVTVVRLWMQNMQTLTARNPVDQILRAFCKRAYEVVPAGTMGRWQENVFCILLPTPAARNASTALAKKCAGIYAYMDGDQPRTLHLQVAVTCFSCPPSADVQTFLKNIDVRGVPALEAAR